ncbi:NAD(P)-binding domain-containing protein [Salinisphaera aquimarina]
MAVMLTASIAAAAAPAGKPPMAKTIAMIGAGNMGQALGNLWAAAGYRVLFASRHPDELDDVVASAGHGAEAAAVGDAIDRAGIVVLAVPYRAEPPIAQQYGERMQDKILVDVDNAFPHRDGEVAVKAEKVGEAVYSARLFEGTRFIRAFNLKGATSFPDPSETDAADFEVPYTTNDESVRPIAEALIRATGGTPKYEGGLENAREY